MCSICYVSGYENIPQQTSLKQLKMFHSADKSSSHNFSWAVFGSKHIRLNDMCIFRFWQPFSTYDLFATLHIDLLLVKNSKLRKKQAKMNFTVRWRLMWWEEFIHRDLETMVPSSCCDAAFNLLSHSCNPRDRQQRATVCVTYCVTCSAIFAVALVHHILLQRKAHVAGGDISGAVAVVWLSLVTLRPTLIRSHKEDCN